MQKITNCIVLGLVAACLSVGISGALSMVLAKPAPKAAACSCLDGCDCCAACQGDVNCKCAAITGAQCKCCPNCKGHK